MYVSTEEARSKLKNLEDGMEWFLDMFQKMNLWLFCTKRFIFGHDEVFMTRANVIDADYMALLLSHEVPPENPEEIPHVQLIFDNIQGIDSLIGQLQKLKAEMEVKVAQQKQAADSASEEQQ